MVLSYWRIPSNGDGLLAAPAATSLWKTGAAPGRQYDLTREVR
jgi:hypothetical protein